MPGGGPGGLGGVPRNLTMPAMQRLAAQAPTPGGLPIQAPTQFGSQDLQDQLMGHMKRAKAAFNTTGKALDKLDLIRRSLNRLSDKKDMVNLDDIIDEAGKLVSHGIDPVALAGVLASAPQEGGGQALAGWVATHAANAAASEQQLRMQHNQNAHDMGVAALHSIMAAVTGHGMPSPQASQVDMDRDLSDDGQQNMLQRGPNGPNGLVGR